MYSIRSIFFLVYIIGIPLGYFFILYERKHHLHLEKHSSMFGSLYEAFHGHFWYFEFIEMVN